MSGQRDGALYPVALARALVIEDHGDDLIVELWHKRGSTRCQVDRAQMLNIGAGVLARSRINTKFV